MAKIKKLGELQYVVVDEVNGEEITSEICKLFEENRTIGLPANSTNRKYLSIMKVDKYLDENDEWEIPFKDATVKSVKSGGTRTPSDNKLKAFMTADELADYERIINGAKATMEAAKNDPVAILQNKIAKLNAALAEALAQKEVLEASN